MKELYLAPEFAKLLGIKRATLRIWCLKGIIRSVKVRGLVFIPGSELKRLEKAAGKAEPQPPKPWLGRWRAEKAKKK